jgi:hypothetical protein
MLFLCFYAVFALSKGVFRAKKEGKNRGWQESRKTAFFAKMS